MFIDASKDFISGKNQNVLGDEHIEKIFKAYQERKDIDKFSYVASMDEIAENGFTLNIPRYVDTSDPVPEIDLVAVTADIKGIDDEIAEISAELKKDFDALGIEFPF